MLRMLVNNYNYLFCKTVVDMMTKLREIAATSWYICGYELPKGEVVYFSQIFILYIIIFISLVNITIGTFVLPECTWQRDLFACLLSSCLGYLLPNPTLKKDWSDSQGDVTDGREQR